MMLCLFIANCFEVIEKKMDKMEILLAVFGIAIFIGLSNGIKWLCYRYIRKENCNKIPRKKTNDK